MTTENWLISAKQRSAAMARPSSLLTGAIDSSGQSYGMASLVRLALLNQNEKHIGALRQQVNAGLGNIARTQTADRDKQSNQDQSYGHRNERGHTSYRNRY